MALDSYGLVLATSWLAFMRLHRYNLFPLIGLGHFHHSFQMRYQVVYTNAGHCDPQGG